MPSVAALVDSHLLRNLTDPETYAAGVELADLDAVRFEEFAPLHTRARVRDGEVFVADLRSGAGKLLWSCSEPGGSRGAFCRHCVAAAVATWRRSSSPESSDAYLADELAEPASSVPPGVNDEMDERPASPSEEAEDRAEEPAAAALVDAEAASFEDGPSAASELPPESPVPAPSPAPAVEPAASAVEPSVPTPAPDSRSAALASAGGVTGVHAIVFSPAAEAVRAFFRDTLGFSSVDAGDGWLIFALPPAELAIHPADAPSHEIYLLCDDLEATLANLESNGVKVRRPVREERWGFVTDINLPGGTDIAIYQPKHPSPLKP